MGMNRELENTLKHYGYSDKCIYQVDLIAEGIFFELLIELKQDKRDRTERIKRYLRYLELLSEKYGMEKEMDQKDAEPFVLIRSLDKVRMIARDEQNWEKKVNQEVEQIRQRHPLVFPAIISVLTAIFLGLLTNCIWEGIQRYEDGARMKKNVQESGFTISAQTNMKFISDPEQADYFKVYTYHAGEEALIGYIKKEELNKLIEERIEP